MIELLSQYSIVTIIVICVTVFSWLFAGIKKIISIYKAAKKAKQDIIDQAMAKKQEQDDIDAKLKEEEDKIRALQEGQAALLDIVSTQQKQIDLLIKSNQLDIKAWIKQQHDYFIRKECIDSQSLDLLELRFKIYEAEHGNGWAVKMMEDLRALPLVTVI